MEDLQQSQILDSCRLALPEGLKDLMSDISREVLRARPHNLYQFIADYLSALLAARDNLSIAGQLYKDICNADCNPELDDELRNIGLTEQEIDDAKKVIMHHLQKDKVKEESLLAKLLNVNIDEQKLPAIQNAVRNAFKRNQFKKNNVLQGLLSDDGKNVASKAAKHTLKLYWKPNILEEHNYEVTGEGEAPYWNNDGMDPEGNSSKTKTSSTDSSEDIFKNIKYDGGIQDLFVSSNCKPHLNSSLTPLNGSYGTLRNRHEKRASAPLERDACINSEDDEEITTKRISFKVETEECVQTSERENDGDDLESVVDVIDELEAVKAADHAAADADKEEIKSLIELDNVEDEALVAEDDWDVSIGEELNTTDDDTTDT